MEWAGGSCICWMHGRKPRQRYRLMPHCDQENAQRQLAHGRWMCDTHSASRGLAEIRADHPINPLVPNHPADIHQRGIVGADLASILAKRTAKPEVRAAARQAAITKAKTQKKDKEASKASAKPAGGAQAPKISKQAMKGAAGGAGKGARY